jgi:DNA-binding SARP family transcriptional activator
MLAIRLLGGFQVMHDGERIAALNTPRLQSLLGFLLLRRGLPQSRQTLASMLWPETNDGQARTNLRNLLHRLRAALPQPDTFLVIDTQSVAWRPGSPYVLDVEQLELALEAAGQVGDDASARTALERATHLYQGELFPECYDDWAVVERQRLHELAMKALGEQVHLLERGEDYAAALERAQRLLQLDPLREATSLSLMRLHLLLGERAAALRVYHQFAAALRDELAVEPGPEMRAAYSEVTSTGAAVYAMPHAAEGRLPLVGREAAQARIRSLWQTAAQGRPHLLLIQGEAGLGKTRLAEDVFAWVERQGADAAMARCYAAEGELAYAPVTAWLRSKPIWKRLATLETIWLAELVRLLPEMSVVRPDLTVPGPITEGWQRRRLLEALARAVLAGERPLLLMLDDLQWCDVDTLEWLNYLLRYAQRAPLMVLATLRPEEAETPPALSGLLGDLRRSHQLTEIGLQPLSADQTAALASHMAGRALATHEAASLFAETEGNPLFIVESLRAGWLGEPGALAGEGQPPSLPMPPSVQAVIAHRLGQLTPGARELLGVAAVIGRSFGVRVLQRAAEWAEPVFVRSLDELWLRHLVREHGADAYDFSHEKVRAAIYAGLSPARRRLLHRRVADALAEDPFTSREAASGQLAAHYEQAGQLDQAAAYYGQAAESAQRLFANAEAIGYLRRGLALLAPLEAGDLRALAARLAERLGDLLHLTGQNLEACEAYQRGLELIASSAHSEDQAAVARAGLQRAIGNALRDVYRYDEAKAAYAAAEAELRLTPETTDGPRWQAWLHLQLDRLQTAYWLADTPSMFALLALAEPVAERYGLPLQRARMSQFAAWAYIRRDGTAFGAAVQAMEDYLNVVKDSGATHALPAARFQYGFILLLHGDLDRAEPELLAALGTAERTGDISLEARCLTYLTVISRRRQHAETVHTYAERSLRVAEVAQMPDYIGAAKGNQAWLAWRVGALSQARTLGQQALDEWGGAAIVFAGQWVALWPLLAVALAEHRILDSIAHARALLDPKQNRLPEVLQTALTEAIRCAEAGDSQAAQAVLLAAQAPARDLGYV